MTAPKTTKKRIAAITMARDDEFFLSRWIKYYGGELGAENLYVYLDGLDQRAPQNAAGVHITKLPHRDMSRAAGDRYRIGRLSDLAAQLFADGYDIVIGCDTDEFLVVDPALGVTLGDYLSARRIPTTLSGLGLDVGQNMNTEGPLDPGTPMLAQRSWALLSTRYTKPVVITRPVPWGSGFHSIRGRNFHIDPNLYLLHFGAVDMNMLLTKAASRGPDWVAHLRRRGNGTIDAVTRIPARGEKYLRIARWLQTVARPVYALDKPGMLGLRWVVKIPPRFKKAGI